MKQYLRRILSLGLALVLMATLILPAAAYDLTRSDQPLHALLGCETAEEVPSCYGLSQEEWEKLQAGYEQFDPQTYFTTDAFYGQYDSTEDYLAEWSMTPAELDEEIVNFWFLDQLSQDYVWVPTVLTAEEEAWLAAHPQQAAQFDAWTWFPESGYAYSYESLQQLQQIWELDDAAAAQAMRKDWVGQQLLAEYEQQWEQEFIDAHPQQYAQFDPDRWYVEEHWGAYLYETPEEYMQANELTREQFVAEMRSDWVMILMGLESDRAWLAEEKVLAGGSADGINVMVDGRCVPYGGVRPVLSGDVVLAPLASTMAQMGVQTGWDHLGAATLYRQGTTLYHKPGTAQMRVVSRDGASTTLELGTASYLQDGEIMIPLAPLAEHLGFQGGWDSEYETLVLVDAQTFRAQVAPRFTHMDRVIATLMGALLPGSEGAQEIQFSLEMEFDGSPVTLKGQELSNELASNVALELSIDPALLDQLLMDELPLDPQEQALVDQMKQLRLEGIVDRAQGLVYLRSPLLALLTEQLSQENAWVSISSQEIPSLSDQMLTMMAIQQLSGNQSMAQQLLSQHLQEGYANFHSYADLQQALTDMEWYADDHWTRSGGGWRLVRSLQDLIAQEQALTQEEQAQMTPEEWAELEAYYDGYGLMPFTLEMTPVGTGCTYRLTIEPQAEGENTALTLSGRPGRLALELEGMDSAFGTLLLRYSVSPSSRTPVSAPPEGDVIVPGDGLL